MDRQAIVEKAWETVDDIKAGPLYQDYVAAERSLVGNPVLVGLITEFNAAKTILEPLKTYGVHHPDWKKASARLAAAKDALFSRPEYQIYVAAQKRLNAELADIGQGLQTLLDECAVAQKKHCQDR